MNDVKSFALSICISLVIGAILSMIAPNIEKNKIFKVVLSAFILSGLVSPIYSIINNGVVLEKIDNIEIIEYATYTYDESVLQDIENNAVISLYPIIKNELLKLGVGDDFGLKLDFNMEKEGIKIKSVNINILDLHRIEKEKLQAHITKNTGLPINIVINEGEEI